MYVSYIHIIYKNPPRDHFLPSTIENQWNQNSVIRAMSILHDVLNSIQLQVKAFQYNFSWRTRVPSNYVEKTCHDLLEEPFQRSSKDLCMEVPLVRNSLVGSLRVNVNRLNIICSIGFRSYKESNKRSFYYSQCITPCYLL